MHNNHIIPLLGIQDKLIKKVEKSQNYINIYVETKPHAQICPKCEASTTSIYDYRIQKIQHITIHITQTYILLKKRRYVCTECCKKFYESYDFIQKGFRKSNDVYNKIIRDSKQIKNIKTIAYDNNVSPNTVNRYISYDIFLNNKANITILPENIGIDEFKGNAGSDKYQVQIVNLDTGKIIDIVETRKYDDLERYFSNITNRCDVKKVTMDLYSPFKKIIQDKFSKAVIIADKFHYTRLVTNALDELRIGVEKDTDKEHKKFFKRLKKLLAIRKSEIKFDGELRLDTAFSISSKLKQAYELKEYFLKINDTTSSQEKEKLFREWIFKAENSKISEFNSVIKTFRTWHKYISNSFKYNFSNGLTEGNNNKIKVLKRISFGFRNFNNFRNRILIHCS